MSAYRINRKKGRECKQPVHQSETERSDHGFELLVWVLLKGLLENGGRVERNDVDACQKLAIFTPRDFIFSAGNQPFQSQHTTHLLGNHDSKGGQIGTSDTRNGEELSES